MSNILDLDPFEIPSWEDYCKNCIKENLLDLFKKKLTAYIDLSIAPIRQELKKLGLERAGEATQDRILRKKYGNNYIQKLAEKRG